MGSKSNTLMMNDGIINESIVEKDCFSCRICLQIFEGYDALDDHIEAVHEKDESDIIDKNIEDETTDEMTNDFDDILRDKENLAVNNFFSDISEEFYEEFEKAQNGINKSQIEMVEINNIKKEEFKLAVYQCNICDMEMKKETAYQKHILKHKLKTGTPLSEEEEGILRKRKESLSNGLHKKIKQRNVDDISNCQKCGGKFQSKLRLEKHMKRHETDDIDKKCMECGKQFLKISKFKVHLISHTNLKEYTCEECSKNYKDHNSLKRHIRGTHNNEKKICPQCGIELGFQSFYLHIKHVHEKKKPQRVQCTFCKKSLVKSKIKKHESKCVSTYSSDGDFKYEAGKNKSNKCNICFKICTAKTLKRHLQSHLKLSPFPCTFCELKYADKRNLQIHQQKTHGQVVEKKFSCLACTQPFSKKRDLEQHMVDKHSVKYHYVCLCGEQFLKTNFEINIARHRQSCQKMDPTLKCLPCDKQFAKGRDLKLHQTLKHQDSDEDQNMNFDENKQKEEMEKIIISKQEL